MKPLDQARVLLRKAAADIVLLEAAAQPPQFSDEIFGFHCQQAVEKACKAALAAHGIVPRRTHDLQELHDLLGEKHVAVPLELGQVTGLTVYAAEFRYSDAAMDQDPLDRPAMLALVRCCYDWAMGIVGKGG